MTEPTMTAKSGLKVSLIRAKPEHALELYEVIASDRDHLKNLTWAATIGLKGVLEHCLKPNVFLIRINRERVAGCLEFREQPDGWTMIGYWDIIAQLAFRYGTYEVVKALAANTAHECATSYKNNDGAVIHRDLPVLQRAVEGMKAAHPLRALADR